MSVLQIKDRCDLLPFPSLIVPDSPVMGRTEMVRTLGHAERSLMAEQCASGWLRHYVYGIAPTVESCGVVSGTGAYWTSLLKAHCHGKFRSFSDLIIGGEIEPVDFLVSADLASSRRDIARFCRTVAGTLKPGGRAAIAAAVSLEVPFWTDLKPETIERATRLLDTARGKSIRIETLTRSIPGFRHLLHGTFVGNQTTGYRLINGGGLQDGAECFRKLTEETIVPAYWARRETYLAGFAAAELKITCEHLDVFSSEQRVAWNATCSDTLETLGPQIESTAPFAVWEVKKAS